MAGVASVDAAMNATNVADSILSGLYAVGDVREIAWRWLLANFSEYALYSYVFFFFVVSAYVVGGGFFFIIDHFDLFHQYKIQQARIPKDADYWKCVVRLLFNYSIIIFPLSFLNHPAMTFLGVRADLPLPSWHLTLGHLFTFLVMEDCLHYIFHRMLHIPVLYKMIHKMHHHHKYPFGITATYASPLEILILAIPTYSGPLLFAPHLSTVYIWILLRELDSVDTHSGYHFPWHPSNFVPYWGASKFHDYHHEVFNCNYASRFTYLDVLFDTYSERNAKEDSQVKKKILAGKQPKTTTATTPKSGGSKSSPKKNSKGGNK